MIVSSRLLGCPRDAKQARTLRYCLWDHGFHIQRRGPMCGSHPWHKLNSEGGMSVRQVDESESLMLHGMSLYGFEADRNYIALYIKLNGFARTSES